MAKRYINENLVAYVDPADTFVTSDGTRLAPPLEDYSIYVSLKVSAKGKNYGMSTDDGTYQLSWESGKRNIRELISGTKIEDISPNQSTELKYITSDGTEFVYSDIANGKVNTHEMLGISSINIDYTNFFVPQITIQFVDVHGASLFGPETEYHTDGFVTTDDGWGGQTVNYRTGIQRNDIQAPFLHAFFTFPYPNYRLEIKGLYGMGVSYDLTMSNWTSSFDSSTGNFNVTATLIGYTYAMLNDLAMSAIITAPMNGYEGFAYWENVIRNNKEEYYLVGRETGPEGNAIYSKIEIPRIASIMGALKDAQLEVQKLKKEHDDNYKGINAIPNSMNNLVGQLASIGNNIAQVVTRRNIEFTNNDGAKYFMLSNNPNGAIFLMDSESVNVKVETTVNGETKQEDYNVVERIRDEFYSLAYNINREFSTSMNKYAEGAGGSEGDSNAETRSQIGNELFKKDGELYVDFITGSCDNIRANQLFVDCNFGIHPDTFAKYQNCVAVVISIKEANRILQMAYHYADDMQQRRAKSLDNEIKEVYSNKLGFVPTIYNITTIIGAHVETFMHCMDKIRDGVFDAMRDDKARSKTKVIQAEVNMKANTDLKNDQYGLPPFPLCVKKNNRGQEEKTWLGETPFSAIEFKPEVDFIEGALAAVESFHKILDETGLSNGGSIAPTIAGDKDVVDYRGNIWHIPFPICPFDFANTTKIYPGYEHIKASPWGVNLTSDVNDLAFRINNRLRMIGKVRMNQSNNHKLISQIYGLIDAQNFYELYEDSLTEQIVQSLSDLSGSGKLIDGKKAFEEKVFFNGNYTSSIENKCDDVPKKFVGVGYVNDCNSSAIKYIKNTFQDKKSVNYVEQAYDAQIYELDGVAQFSAYATGWKDLSTLKEKYEYGDFKYSGQTDNGEENRIGYPKNNLQYFGEELYTAMYDDNDGDKKLRNLYYGYCRYSGDTNNTWNGWERFKIHDKGYVCLFERRGNDLLLTPEGDLLYARADRDESYGKGYYKNLVNGHIVKEFKRACNEPNYVLGSDSGLYYSVFSDTQLRIEGLPADDYGDFVAETDSVLPSVFSTERYGKVDRLSGFTDDEKTRIHAFMFLNALNIRNYEYVIRQTEGCMTLPKALVLNYGSYVDIYKMCQYENGNINVNKAKELEGVIFNKVDNDGKIEFYTQLHQYSNNYGVDYRCQYKIKLDNGVIIEPTSNDKFVVSFNDKMREEFLNWINTPKNRPDSFNDISEIYSFMLINTNIKDYGIAMYGALSGMSGHVAANNDATGKKTFITKGYTTIDDQIGIKRRLFASLDRIKEAERLIGKHCIDYDKFDTEKSAPYCGIVGFDEGGNIYALNAPAPKDASDVRSRALIRLLLQPVLICIPQIGMHEDNKHRIYLETEEYYKAFAFEVARLSKENGQAYLPEISYDDNGQVCSTVVRNPNIPRDVKIALYGYLKNLYDRWLDNPWCDGNVVKTLAAQYGLDYFIGPYDGDSKSRVRDKGHFVFIDSYYNNMDHYLNINLTELIRQIQYALESENRTLLQFLTEMFAKHKITVQCIQNFANLSAVGASDNKIISNLFKPVPLSRKGYTDPKSFFVCIYAGEPAQTSISKDRKDEGLYLTGPNYNLKNVKIENDGYRIPAFAVAYGDQYQHYFQDINVGMSTSLATEQSIKTQFDLAKLNTNSEVESIGQDLYTIYSNNSYETTIKMLGCPWIQPTMYFEMLNIPMFNGAYMIKKVNHVITPGFMETTIHGIRQNRLCVPAISEAIIVNQNLSSAGADLGSSPSPTSSTYRMELTYEYYSDNDVENEIPDDIEEDLRILSDNAYRTFYRINKSIEACEWAKKIQGQKFNVEVLAPDVIRFYNGGYLDIIFDLILKKYDKDIATLSWVAESFNGLVPNSVIITVDNNLPKVYQENGTTFTINTTIGGTPKNNKDAGCTVNFLTEGEVTGLYIEHIVDTSEPTASFTGPLFAKYISQVTQDEYTGNRQVLSSRVQREIDEMTVDRVQNMSNTGNYPQLASNVAYADLGDDKDRNSEYLRTYLANGGNAFRQRLGGMSNTEDTNGGLPFWSDGNEVRLGDGRMACFTVSDLCKSDTARKNHIENKPDTEAQYQCLIDIIVNILQPLCDKYGRDRIRLGSGYRCKAVNDLIPGSSLKSQHQKGQAIDIELLSQDHTKELNAALFAFIVKNLQFDQIIWEKGGAWVHVSFNKGHNRREIKKGPINGTYPIIAASWEREIRWDGDYHF